MGVVWEGIKYNIRTATLKTSKMKTEKDQGFQILSYTHVAKGIAKLPAAKVGDLKEAALFPNRGGS